MPESSQCRDAGRTRRRPGTPCRVTEDRRDDAAERGADREHRAPEGAAQRVRGRQVLAAPRGWGSPPTTPDRTAPRRREDREQWEREPDRARPDEQERDAHDHPCEVASDHQSLAVEPIGQHARPRRGEEERELLREDREPDVDRPSRGIQDQAVDRDEQEPVSAERDHRREEQPPEVAVAAQQRHARADAAVGDRGGHGFGVVALGHGSFVRLRESPPREAHDARTVHVVPTVGVPVGRR